MAANWRARRLVEIALLIVFVVVAAAVARSPEPNPLRSEHSAAAAKVPVTMVAVSPEGNLFHKPGCKYLKGKVEMMSSEEAVRRGYSPCTRCMREALVH